jgi:hypothetical protein
MSATADAYMLAIQRAFPALDVAGQEAFSERFFAGNATLDEEEAVQREFAKVTRTDIGRPPLPDTIPPDVLAKVAAGVLADLDGALRRCCDCSGWFDGPGPRCPGCTEKRNAVNDADNLRLLRTAAASAVKAIESALVEVDYSRADLSNKTYETLWDAMIGLKRELPPV